MSAALLAALLSAAPARAGAAGGGFADLPVVSAKLGEPTRVRAVLRLAQDQTAELDLARSTTDVYAISQFERIELRPEPGGRIEVYEFSLLPLAFGRFTIPLVWIVGGAGGAGSLVTPVATLDVPEPPPFAGCEQPRELKGPIAARPPLWPWLLLAAALAAAVYALRRRARPGAAGAGAPPPDGRAPHERAAAELDALELSGLWDQGRHKEFYSELTAILRRYLEARFAVAATRMTSRELERSLRDGRLARGGLGRLRLLLDRADLVKFAKAPTEDEWGKLDLGSARALLAETAPQELAVQAGAPEPAP